MTTGGRMKERLVAWLMTIDRERRMVRKSYYGASVKVTMGGGNLFSHFENGRNELT
jgi:hypothetical protein